MDYVIEITKKGSASDDIFTQFIDNRGLGILTTDQETLESIGYDLLLMERID